MILPCSIAFITSWCAVSLFLSLLVSAMLNECKGNLGLFWFCFTTLSDWSKIPSHSLNQPDLIQKLISKINKRLLHLHFSIFFWQFSCFHFEFMLASWDACNYLCSDWLWSLLDLPHHSGSVHNSNFFGSPLLQDN